MHQPAYSYNNLQTISTKDNTKYMDTDNHVTYRWNFLLNQRFFELGIVRSRWSHKILSRWGQLLLLVDLLYVLIPLYVTALDIRYVLFFSRSKLQINLQYQYTENFVRTAKELIHYQSSHDFWLLHDMLTDAFSLIFQAKCCTLLSLVSYWNSSLLYPHNYLDFLNF